MKIIISLIFTVLIFSSTQADQKELFKNKKVYQLETSYACNHQGSSIFSKKVYKKTPNGAPINATNCAPTPSGDLSKVECPTGAFDHDLQAGKSWPKKIAEVKKTGEKLGDCFRDNTAPFLHQSKADPSTCPDHFNTSTLKAEKMGTKYIEVEGKHLSVGGGCVKISDYEIAFTNHTITNTYTYRNLPAEYKSRVNIFNSLQFLSNTSYCMGGKNPPKYTQQTIIDCSPFGYSNNLLPLSKYNLSLWIQAGHIFKISKNYKKYTLGGKTYDIYTHALFGVYGKTIKTSVAGFESNEGNGNYFYKHEYVPFSKDFTLNLMSDGTIMS